MYAAKPDMTPEEAALGMKPRFSPDSSHNQKSKEEREKVILALRIYWFLAPVILTCVPHI